MAIWKPTLAGEVACEDSILVGQKHWRLEGMHTEEHVGHIVGDPFALATVSIAYVRIPLLLDTIVNIGVRLNFGSNSLRGSLPSSLP